MTERVWDRFLSERDKEDLGMRPSRQPVPLGKKPGLLLVDLYRNVFGDRPQPLHEAVKDWPGSCGTAAWDAVPYIQRLLSVAREVQIPVTHVTMLVNTGIDGGATCVAGGRHDGKRRTAPRKNALTSTRSSPRLDQSKVRP